MNPVDIVLDIVREDHQEESAKAHIWTLVHLMVVEGLTQLFSNDRVFLCPGLKEAIDHVAA